MKRISTLLILMLVTAAVSTAQQSLWTVYAGWNVAVGRYGTVGVDNGDWALISPQSDRGGAGFGSNFGVSFRYWFEEGNKTGIVFNAEYYYTPVSMKIKTDNMMTLINTRGNFDKADISNPSFNMMPLLGGFFFETDLKEDKLKLYFDLQAGVAITCITDYEVEFRGAKTPIVEDGKYFTDYCYTRDYNTTALPAARLGVGIRSGKHISLDLGLLWRASNILRGNVEYDFTYTTYSDPTPVPLRGNVDFIAGQITPLLLSFRMGYNF